MTLPLAQRRADAKILAGMLFGFLLGVAITSLTFAIAASNALHDHVRDGHALDRMDDTTIQEPACGVIFRVDSEERVPVATIGHCGPTPSPESEP